jgi:hypothetical protein
MKQKAITCSDSFLVVFGGPYLVSQLLNIKSGVAEPGPRSRKEAGTKQIMRKPKNRCRGAAST